LKFNQEISEKEIEGLKDSENVYNLDQWGEKVEKWTQTKLKKELISY